MDQKIQKHSKARAAARRIETPQIPQLSSKTCEHYTPPHVIEAAHEVLGVVDLDPASCATANTVVGATRFFTQADDGLVRPWNGKVFVNPPGGTTGNKSQARAFYFKAVREWMAGRAAAVIFLGFTLELLRLSQAEATIPSALRFPLCVLRNRLAFLTDVGGKLVPQTAPTHANVVIYMPSAGDREELAAFERTFSALGEVSIPTRLATRLSNVVGAANP